MVVKGQLQSSFCTSAGACPNFSTSTAPLPAALIGLRCLVGKLTGHFKAVSVSLSQVSHLSVDRALPFGKGL